MTSLPRDVFSGIRNLHSSQGPTTGYHSEPISSPRKTQKHQKSWLPEFVLLAAFSICFAVYFFGSVTLMEGARLPLGECPINSICERGRVASCVAGYRFMREVCVLESETEILAREMSLYLAQRIAELNGAAHCEQNGEKVELRVDRAEDLLKETFGPRTNHFFESLVALYQNSLNQLYPELQSAYDLNTFQQTFSAERVVLHQGCAFWQKLAFSGFKGPLSVLVLIFLVILLVKKLRLRRAIAEAEKIYLFARNSVLAKRILLNIGEFVGSFGVSGQDDDAVLDALERIRSSEAEIGKIVQENAVYWTALN